VRWGSRLLAVLLCVRVYSGLAGLIFFWSQQHPPSVPPISRSAVTLSFEQIDLRAVVEEAVPEPQPEPEPAIEKPVVKPVLPEEVDVAVEKIQDPMPEPVEQDAVEAQVTQEASAPVIAPVSPDLLRSWIRELLEREKYYPRAAREQGLEGAFTLAVQIDEAGEIVSTEITGGKGHIVLRNALQKMLTALPGQSFGRPLPTSERLEFEFKFNLD
jgi:protein TonB